MQLVPNTFTTYAFESPMEALQAQQLSMLQQANIRNELAKCAEQKVNILFDANNPVKFAQDTAFLDGQISILRWLLDCHDTATYLIQNPDSNPDNQPME